jgi:chromosome partitioning protein
MRRIAVINQKGGVGKTTTAVNLGAALARTGERVLLIDLDPQGHLTLHLGMDRADGSPTTYDLLARSIPISQARRPVKENLWCVGACIELAAAEPELMGVVGREMILRDLIDAEEGRYDYVLVDCPPSLGLLTLNALAAVRELFVPVQPHFLALQGLGNLLKTVNLVSRRVNPKLRVGGILLCMFESGTRLAGKVVDDLRSFLEQAGKASMPWAEARLFETRIRRNIKLAECPSHGLTIFDYAPKSHGAVDYEMLAAEVSGKPMPMPMADRARADSVEVSWILEDVP